MNVVWPSTDAAWTTSASWARVIREWLDAYRVAFRNGWDVVSIWWFCVWQLVLRPTPRRT